MAQWRKGELSSRQLRFIDEYLVDNVASRAAIRAGYSPRSAAPRGCALLRRPEIQERIRLGSEARSGRLRLAADRALSELARIAFADLRRYVVRGKDGELRLRPLDKLSDDEAAPVASLSRGERARRELHDKLRALQLIAPYLGLVSKRRDRAPPAPLTAEDEDPREVLRRMIGKLAAKREPDA